MHNHCLHPLEYFCSISEPELVKKTFFFSFLWITGQTWWHHLTPSERFDCRKRWHDLKEIYDLSSALAVTKNQKVDWLHWSYREIRGRDTNSSIHSSLNRPECNAATIQIAVKLWVTCITHSWIQQVQACFLGDVKAILENVGVDHISIYSMWIER